MDSRHVLIDHLARELQAMETARVPLNPLRYQLNARMLRQALVGFPMAPLLDRPAGAHPQVVHALADRYFEDTGRLMIPNAAAAWARSLLERTLARCAEPGGS